MPLGAKVYPNVVNYRYLLDQKAVDRSAYIVFWNPYGTRRGSTNIVILAKSLI